MHLCESAVIAIITVPPKGEAEQGGTVCDRGQRRYKPRYAQALPSSACPWVRQANLHELVGI